MIADTAKWFEMLQNDGCRLTAPRRAVVETLKANMHALTPVEVYESARKQCPGLGLVSVYRTLEKLEELGLIQRVHQTKGCQAFVRTGEGHQHLLVCNNCGKVVLFEGDQLDALFKTISKTSGFQIDGHWLQVFGLCKNCQS
jgi:Fur family transcriptional regulator, ferric uptake regulator